MTRAGAVNYAPLIRPASGSGQSLRGGHPRRLALGAQFEQSTAVVARSHLDKRGDRPVPIVEKRPGAGAAGIEQVTLDQDAQPLAVEAQRVAHPVIDDSR